MDIPQQLRSYFAKTIVCHIHDDDDIFELGLVDSLFAMQLVAFIEKEFYITVERDDLDIANFSSIAALAAFVEAKCQRRDRVPPA